MYRERDSLFDLQVDAYRDLNPEMQKALMLRSIGVPDTETGYHINTDSIYHVRGKVKRGFEFLATKNPGEIRGIIKTANPQKYEAELSKRKLVEINGSLFNQEDMDLMAKLALGATIRELAGEENYSTVTSRISYRLYKRLGVKNGADSVKRLMFKKFPNLVRYHAEMNGQFMVGKTVFSADESILIYEILMGSKPKTKDEDTIKTICKKLRAKNIWEVVERARETYPVDK